MGVNPKRHLTREAWFALNTADRVFIESYTSVGPPGWKELVQECTKRPVEHLTREQVEDGGEILSSAERGQTVLAVLGDPAFATTHSALVERSRDKGIKTQVLPGVSILSLGVAATGLQSYKFGRATTVPRWQPGFEPLSPLDPIRDNLARGMHTLVLLDTGDGDKPMGAIEGGKLLLQMSARTGEKEPLVGDETMVIVLERLGWDDEIVSVCHLGEWGDVEFGPPPHALVIPGALHVSEVETVRRIVGGKFGGG